MTKDKLIKAMTCNKQRKRELLSEINEIDEREKILEKFLIDSISFNTNVLINMICTLILMKENKQYIPFKGEYFNNQKVVHYLVLISTSEIIEKGTLNLTEYSDKLLIYQDYDKLLLSSDKHELTFNYLLDEYLVGIGLINDYKKRISFCEFNEYPYIKEFISKLAELQVENCEHLTEEEMLIAMSDFINIQKDKPKTKELKKD